MCWYGKPELYAADGIWCCSLGFLDLVVCDQGSNNRSMIEKLVSVSSPYFIHQDTKIYVLYDPPHLIKNIHNNFKRTGFTIGSDSIKWEYIKQFYDVDNEGSQIPSLKMAPKLTKKHIDLPPFTVMRVKLATQILSHTVAAGINTLVKLKKMDEAALPTANFIAKFNSLFDVFNSSTHRSQVPMRTALKKNSLHWSFLRDCSNWLKELKQAGTGKTLPCIEGWKLAIASMTMLWEDLSENHQVAFLLTNRCNQDCLENFFSVIRGKGKYTYFLL